MGQMTVFSAGPPPEARRFSTSAPIDAAASLAVRQGMTLGSSHGGAWQPYRTGRNTQGQMYDRASEGLLPGRSDS